MRSEPLLPASAAGCGGPGRCRRRRRRRAWRMPISMSGRRSTKPSAWRCSKRKRAVCRWWLAPAAGVRRWSLTRSAGCWWRRAMSPRSAINEAFGMALLEAQASGLPVVAGASGGVAEVVADTVSGLLVAPGDVAAFAAAVRRLLDDPELRRCYAAAARRRVVAEHDLRPAAQQLGAVLRDLRPAPAA